MGGRPTPAPGATKGNFISEWFGHRVWPDVSDASKAVADQSARACPFLSNATGEERQCIKVPRGGKEPTGVCTISSDSNGKRQDWLACPYRTLDQGFTLLVEAVRSLYGVEPDDRVIVLPVTVLPEPTRRAEVTEALRDGSVRVFAFAADKLGGEVDLPETEASPGAKVDVSIIEILGLDERTGEPSEFGKHVIYEIQTADFHGSPLHAVRHLQALCPQGSGPGYHAKLRQRVEVCGKGVEGPNKANVFKRTVYQMILKIKMAEHPQCAGFCLIIPLAVWDSWLRHLGFPDLERYEHGGTVVALAAPDEDEERVLETARTWILVTDIDRYSSESPQPLAVVYRIATTARALMHQTFDAAATHAIEAGVIDRYRETLEDRVRTNWQG